MTTPVGLALSDLLGQGYAGAVQLGSEWLLLRGSSATEEDNLIRATGAISNFIPNATGEIPVRNRRSLTLNLVCDLNYASIQEAILNSFTWRNAGENGFQTSCSVYLANGEGYSSSQAYVDTISISVPEDGLGQINFGVKSWVWTDLTGTNTPRIQTVFNPFGVVSYQPIPYWATLVNHPGQTGVPLAWTLNISNGYAFYQLCEATPSFYPPNPRVVSPGPLMVDLALSTIAVAGNRPSEIASNVVVQVGGFAISGNTVPSTTITIPEMYRDGRATQGFGEQNPLIRWMANWKAIGNCPVVS